ncbi:MAG: hypothetical protein LC105_06985 [Chitinophagales bacterium]|nr:hypothetical protein [Chitinophagales bacterium]MCZ2393580.1 hypothetical protein [Chitinophagales bacterium]
MNDQQNLSDEESPLQPEIKKEKPKDIYDKKWMQVLLILGAIFLPILTIYCIIDKDYNGIVKMLIMISIATPGWKRMIEKYKSRKS